MFKKKSRSAEDGVVTESLEAEAAVVDEEGAAVAMRYLTAWFTPD